jgi:DNA-binding IclR family transcriptional regulator
MRSRALSLLAWLYDREYTATELATRFGIALTTVLRDANRLVEAGLIRDRTVGWARGKWTTGRPAR